MVAFATNKEWAIGPKLSDRFGQTQCACLASSSLSILLRASAAADFTSSSLLWTRLFNSGIAVPAFDPSSPSAFVAISLLFASGSFTAFARTGMTSSISRPVSPRTASAGWDPPKSDPSAQSISGEVLSIDAFVSENVNRWGMKTIDCVALSDLRLPNFQHVARKIRGATKGTL